MIFDNHWKHGFLNVVFSGMLGLLTAQSTSPTYSQNKSQTTASQNQSNTKADSDTPSSKSGVDKATFGVAIHHDTTSPKKGKTNPNSSVAIDNDTTSPKNFERMDTVLVQSKNWKFKRKGLYDEALKPEPENINGFYALQILDEDLGKDIWISLEPKCVKLEKISDESAHRGKHSFRLTWDKISGGCTWLGMGMGWDNWQPKDLSSVLDTAYLELHFKSLSDTMTNLPLALAMEDYSGAQCWLGFDSKWLNEPIVTQQWNTVRIPLKSFPFEDFETDPTSIKQFIIQLEADGDLLIDNFRISL